MVLSIGPACEQADCYFLENFKGEDITNSVAYNLGSVIFWKNYSD